MRFIFIFYIFIFYNSYGQDPYNSYKKLNEISAMEERSHGRLSQLQGQEFTAASNNFDVKYYRCEWEVDPAIRFINGKVTVYYLTTTATPNITLDLMSPLTVDSVKQRTNLLINQQVNNTVQINFPASVNAGILDSVSIYYKGVPPTSGFGSFIQDQHAGTPVMWSLSEPFGSRDWWPCKNGLNDKADSIDIFITAPAQYKAASNGMLQSETLVAGNTKKITHWKHRYPIASYLMCFAVTNYVVFNNSVQLGAVSLPMQTYCYPENLTSFQNGTQNVLDAMQLFHNTFGDYPFIKEKYGHVQFGWGGGMEHQTSTFIISINEGLIAHELAHQWFGDKITCNSWEDIWLNEGFATHVASFYTEKKYPATTIANRKNEIDYITSQAGGSVKVDDTTNAGRIFDGRLSYYKGSHLLYMLRWKLGDSVFFKAIRAYQQDAKVIYGFARTADLKKHLEEESGQDLTKFFNDWYAGQGYPTYNIEWTPVGSNYVRIKMNQTTSHTSVSFFDLPVALKFKNATQQKTIVVDNKTNGEVFIKNLGFVADSVFIDPDYWLISKKNTAVKVPDAVTDKNLVQVFPNPVKNPFYIYLRNFSSSTATITIYNMAGQRVYTQSTALINGSEYLEIPTGQLAKGQYILQVKGSDGFKYVQKIIK
jgi:aminopeptidase N